jgi:Carboxypeptidase regulatory-like domain/TonB dependent receptor
MWRVDSFLVTFGDRSRNAFTCVTMLILAFALCSTPRPVLAQGITASIVGTVTDPAGGLLADAQVTVVNVDTELKRTTQTDKSGSFEITLLPIGHYRVTAGMAGFKTATVSQITLAEGDRLNLDLRMEIGQLEQSVKVMAQTPALQTETSNLGTLFDKQAIEDLPLNGRNFMQLAQLAAGANAGAANALASGNRPDDRRNTSNVTVNGQMSYSNNFLIDGLDDNERYIGTLIIKPSVDALAEFKVSTNTYPAELSRTSGGVIEMITKSGTDSFHGSLYEFFRNQDVDAKNFFAGPGPNPDYKQNQFGGSIGGPIKKGKTFFFGDYEGTRLLQGITYTSSVPTLAMRQGNFSGIANVFNPITRTPFPNNQIPSNMINPTGQNLVNLYPLPQRPGLVNNFSFSPDRQVQDNKFDVRVDQQLGQKGSLFARYSFDDVYNFLPPELPAVGDIQAGSDTGYFAGPAHLRAQSAATSYLYTFNSTLMLQQTLGYARLANHTFPPNYGNTAATQLGIPGANIDADSSGLPPISVTGFRGLGDGTSTPIIDYNNIYQYAGTITKIAGQHSLKFGTNLIIRRLMQFQSNEAKGEFTFNSSASSDGIGDGGNAIASMLLGYPASTVRSKTLYRPDFHAAEYGFYAQDDWRVTPTLTLNIGLRYDIITPPEEAHGLGSNLNLNTFQIENANVNGISKSGGLSIPYNDFSPRFGFAYNVTPRTVVRGGFGISFFPPVVGNSQGLRNAPFVSTLNITTTPATVANLVSAGLPYPTPDNPLAPAGSLNALFMGNRMPYVEQYNLTVQREFFAGLVGTLSYVGTGGRKLGFAKEIDQAPPGPGAVQARRYYYAELPGISSISEAYTAGTSTYSSVQSSLERRFTHGFGLSTNFTFGHAIDDFACRGGCKPGNTAGPFPLLSRSPQLDRGNSDVDLRLRWTLSATYAPSYSVGSNRLTNIVAKDWQFNGILVMQSGQTFTVENGTARDNTGSGDRPDLVGNPHDINRSISEWFNTQAFAPQPLYTVGDVGRNTMYGPPFKQLDFSTFKDFKVKEDMTLQFRAEFFNIFNHPNFGFPGVDLGTAAFGVISDTGNNLARNIQFALKLVF